MMGGTNAKHYRKIRAMWASSQGYASAELWRISARHFPSLRDSAAAARAAAVSDI
jgi:hypothetical protein